MRIRRAEVNDSKSIANVNINVCRTTYRGIMPDEDLDNLSYHDREKFCKDLIDKKENDAFIYVAEDEVEGVIGYNELKIIIEHEGGEEMKNYMLGFSSMGLLLYTMQLLPNIIWMISPPANNVLTKNSSAYSILNITEQVFGIMTVALLILLINKDSGRNSNHYIGLAIIFLVGYYIAWIFYYKGVVSPWLLIIGIAAMPPLYFLFVGIWMKNYVALIPCVIFGVMQNLIISTQSL